MRLFSSLVFLPTFIAVAFFSLSTSACEGDCITNTTNEFIRLYATPLKTLLDHTVGIYLSLVDIDLASRFNLPSSSNCVSYLQDAYAKIAYAYLENAIFPSYFHGKCQQRTANGTLVNPPGCPNPDCPVVCGTPGSMVHHYDALRNITVNSHEGMFALLTKQDSGSFQDVKTCVLGATTLKKCPQEPARTTRSFSRSFAAHFPRSLVGGSSSGFSPRENCYDDTNFEKNLYDVLQAGMVQMWADVCDAKKDYAKCSWEKEMKAFILQFP
ncbi:hypothetical protein F5051DRAFT_430413 [Lentinula edodes]|nr:hypothetical protein F5051DRAFT_430413 [Lentinula edodes]